MRPSTEAEFLNNLETYLDDLKKAGRLGANEPRVCHHFFPLDGAPANAYLPGLPEKLAKIDPEGLIEVIGDPVGLEVWDLLEPAMSWLAPRISAFHKAAVEHQAVYAGWSYEPRRG